ncbi:LON peptidase substrate-binding domain-containing protein [Vibrio algarum]|uniref:LON peptidase substrate-binding domain-containing protein n=1 Tax=Vibrio algarum TaxID=3020714 RepID=A0ABT4YVK1_9VIBR|nr:LON peptidase substrate-binding domain-containing protein [Vibrio sp. KJ40-1]MDB1125606.1 LON peptidase substrate-binding domain-containing protein [Vibrio sp. KJ40-1]
MINVEQKTHTNPLESIQYPVFPLPIFVLPGGMQRLRIFEPKYTAMITNAQNTDGFVIALYRKENGFSVPDWGVHVQIVDFDSGEDGILTVDVLADHMVSLSNFEQQQDGLLIAKTTVISHWSSNQDSASTFDGDSIEQVQLKLSTVLQGVFNAHNELNKLYKTQFFDYPNWVCARLLEIIPLSLDEKEKFVQQLEYKQLTTLLSTLCEKELNKM